MNSGTIGPVKVGAVLPSLVGPAPGGTASAISSEMVLAATQRLVNQKPKETDAHLLATLRRRYGCSIEPRTQWMFPNDRPAYKRTMGLSVSLSDVSDVPGALRDARLSLLPADRPLLVRKIAELKAKTKSRAQDEMDMGMEIAVYEKELSRYPADIALEGLRLSAEQNMWFPSWFEMKEILDKMLAPRLMVVDKLMALQA